MKLWRIYQDVVNGYDTYDSAVVAAETEQQARETPPAEYLEWGNGSWAPSPKNVGVQYLGEAAQNIEAGVICASFNAG